MGKRKRLRTLKPRRRVPRPSSSDEPALDCEPVAESAVAVNNQPSLESKLLRAWRAVTTASSWPRTLLDSVRTWPPWSFVVFLICICCPAWLHYANSYLSEFNLTYVIKLSYVRIVAFAAAVADTSTTASAKLVALIRTALPRVAWYLQKLDFVIMDFSVLLRFVSPNFFIAFISLAWLFYRLRKVLNIPVDDLVKILGLEVPAPPSTTLLDVSSTGATIRWKPPELRTSVAKYLVRINGIVAGEISPQDNAVTISDLPPGRCYTIRIVAVNTSNFQASSEPTRIKLPAALDGPDEKSPAALKRKRSDNDSTATTNMGPHPPPTVVACKAFPDLLTSVSAPTMAREHSGSYSQPKRGSTSARRSSPAVPSSAQSPPFEDRENEAEALQTLNAKLEDLRAQTAEVERLDDEDEAEFQRNYATLLEQRDSLRKQLKERDDETKDLNKVVKSLEHANSAAQNKKLQQEKALQEKIRAREKMQEEIARWDKEVPEIEAEIATLEKQLEDVQKSNEESVQAIKAEQKPDLEALALLEEQIQERGREVQELEQEKKRLEEESAADSPEVIERDQAMKREEQQWIQRLAYLQNQLSGTMSALRDTSDNYNHIQQRLEMLNYHRNSQSQPNGFPQGFVLEPSQSVGHDRALAALPPLPSQADQTTGMRTNFELPEGRGNPLMSLHSQTRSNPTTSATLHRTSSPLVNPSFNVALPDRPQNSSGDIASNMENLTGGAMTSPTAGDLLPSGLLDNEDMGQPRVRNLPPLRSDSNRRSRPTSMTSAQFPSAFGRAPEGSTAEAELLPGLGNIPGLIGDAQLVNSRRSPAESFASPSGSAVSSPHQSLANLHSQHFSDPSVIDADRRSIKSASGGAPSAMTQTSKRFDLLFGRQRGKTTTEGPALGSLRSSQSQSMPRDADEGSSAYNVTRRNQSKTGSGLFEQMSNTWLGRKSAVAGAANAAAEPADFASSLARTGSVSSFSSANNPWSRNRIGRRASASRPDSTYSTENALPRPTGDISRFGWGMSKESLHRSGSIHAGSAVNPNPWSSELPSRRTSVQQDAKPGSLWEIGDAELEEDEDLEVGNSPPPAPIGTKPKKGKDLAELSKQLNPNARDFTSMFSFGKWGGDKAEKTPTKSKKKDKKQSAVDDMASSMTDDSSPADSRKSRDTLLSSNAESFEEAGLSDAGNVGVDETTESNPSTPQPESSANQASPGGRDSLMKMLSRKGSSGRFSLPTRGKDKTSLFSRKTNQAEETEDDSGSSAKLGQSVESITSTPSVSTPDKRSSGFSLSFKRKSKKADDTPSISEASVTNSEAGDEEEDELTTP